MAVLTFFQSLDFVSLWKAGGINAVVAVVFLVLLLGAAKWGKTILTDTIADARKDRDASRQLLKEMAAEFTEHTKRENDEFREALRDVVTAFERTGHKK